MLICFLLYLSYTLIIVIFDIEQLIMGRVLDSVNTGPFSFYLTYSSVHFIFLLRVAAVKGFESLSLFGILHF